LAAEENGWKLPDSELAQLKRSSKDLKDALRNPRLRELILKVDSAKDRERALTVAMAESKGRVGGDLEVFLQSTLRALHCYDTRPDGSEFLKPNTRAR
jgi:hypothetical protein